LARDGQMRAPRGEASVLRSTASRAVERRPSVMGGRARLRGLSDPGRHHHCPASRIRSTKHQENHFLAGIKKAAWGEAAWGSFKCLKEGGMRVA